MTQDLTVMDIKPLKGKNLDPLKDWRLDLGMCLL